MARVRGVRCLLFLCALVALSCWETPGASAASAPVKKLKKVVQSNGKEVSRLKKPKDKLAKQNVELANSLDIKSLTTNLTEMGPSVQPRHVVVAFMSIAWEASERSKGAVENLQNAIKKEQFETQVEEHDMRAWIANQRTVAEHKVRLEEERVGKMMDEVNHLQHIYEDAVAKAESYQRQSAELVSERQLQTTPPLMPSVAAAALTQTQYKDALTRLATYLRKAQAIMQRSAQGVTSREHLILLAQKWITESKAALKLWLDKEEKIVQKRVKQHVVNMKKMGERASNFAIIMKDALRHFKIYRKVLKRLDVKMQMEQLTAQLKAYAQIKTFNTYDKSKIRSFLSSINLELRTLKKRLAQLPGKDKVAPPPAAWGVLASYHPTHPDQPPPYPVLHLPVFVPPSISGPAPPPLKPVTLPLPQARGTNDPTYGQSRQVVAFSNPYVWQHDSSVAPYAPPLVPVNAQGVPVMGAPTGSDAALSMANSGTPPAMPKLPPPPDSQLASLGV